MCVFHHVRSFTLFYGYFICLIIVLFGPIFMEKFVIFSNARSILKLMLCNQNLTWLDIITLLSSDCRAWPLKLCKHFKKWQNIFCLHFANSDLNIIFSRTLSLFSFLNSYNNSSFKLRSQILGYLSPVFENYFSALASSFRHFSPSCIHH